VADAPARGLVRPPLFALDVGCAFDHATEIGKIAAAAEVPLRVGCSARESIAIGRAGSDLQFQLQACRRLASLNAEAQVVVIVGCPTCRSLILILGRPVDVDHLAPAEDLLEAIENQRIVPLALLVPLALGGEASALVAGISGRRVRLLAVVRL
jgi:hypothetical protein